MFEKLVDTCGKIVTSHWTTTDWQILFGVVVGFIALLGLIVLCRVWFRGDDFEIPRLLKISPNKQIRDLQATVTGLSKDDKLKRNVLLLLRDRIAEMTAIISRGSVASEVHGWSNNVLINVTAAVSRGLDDQHRAAIWHVPEAGALFQMYAAHGFRADSVQLARLQRNSSAGRVYQTGVGEIVSDVTKDQGYEPKQRRGQAYASMLLLPLKNAAGDTIGVLCVDALEPGYFDDDDKFIASCFADLLDTLLAGILRRAP